MQSCNSLQTSARTRDPGLARAGLARERQARRRQTGMAAATQPAPQRYNMQRRNGYSVRNTHQHWDMGISPCLACAQGSCMLQLAQGGGPALPRFGGTTLRGHPCRHFDKPPTLYHHIYAKERSLFFPDRVAVFCDLRLFFAQNRKFAISPCLFAKWCKRRGLLYRKVVWMCRFVWRSWKHTGCNTARAPGLPRTSRPGTRKRSLVHE
jgi:hypothetical protein